MFAYLHGRVVEGYEGGEQIQVTCGEHQGKQDLTLPRNTCSETEGSVTLQSQQNYNYTLEHDPVTIPEESRYSKYNLYWLRICRSFPYGVYFEAAWSKGMTQTIRLHYSISSIRSNLHKITWKKYKHVKHEGTLWKAATECDTVNMLHLNLTIFRWTRWNWMHLSNFLWYLCCRRVLKSHWPSGVYRL